MAPNTLVLLPGQRQQGWDALFSYISLVPHTPAETPVCTLGRGHAVRGPYLSRFSAKITFEQRF